VVEVPELPVTPDTLLLVHDDRLVVTLSVWMASVVLSPGLTVATPLNAHERLGCTFVVFAWADPAPTTVAAPMTTAATATSVPRRPLMAHPAFEPAPSG